jgi:cytochrome c peroxidase
MPSMNRQVFAISILCALLCHIFGCRKQPSESKSSTFPGFKVPEHFAQPVYHFQSNEVTEAGFVLGRRLFYEPRLSRNNTISCGSCHIQSAAFTHHGHDVSHGIDDRLGRRNAPPIMNLAWTTHYMWDGGIFDLDLQPIAPITAHEEMDESVERVVHKLSNHPEYPLLFEKAFGSKTISSANMLKALSQFMLMCISSNAKYDSVKTGQVAFTALEQEGYQIFQIKCNACHQEPLFTDFSFRNNGIGIGYSNDSGRYAVTLNPDDLYRFKVPSLRNLRFTAPYMHDGRFYTIDAVLDQYAHHIVDMDNLDPLLKAKDTLGIQLSEAERIALKAFLNTLNDFEFVTNPLLSEQ